MIRIVSLMLGLAAMGVVSLAGYMNNVSLIHLLVRGMLAFFIFYFTGTVVSVIVVKGLVDGLEKKRSHQHADVQKSQVKPQQNAITEAVQ